MISVPFETFSNGNNILGVWDEPDNTNNLPYKKVCLVCVGLNGNRIEKNRMLIKLSRALTSNGISVVRFEYRGIGVSDGNFCDVSISTKVDDIKKVINTIYDTSSVDVELSLLSYSDGISIVLHMLEEVKIEFNKLIAWSPILVPVQSESKEPIRFVREPNSKQLVVPFGGLWLGKEYLKDISNYDDLIGKLQPYANKTKCIFGMADVKVKKTIEALDKNTDIKKSFICGANHEFSANVWLEEVILQTLKWLKNQEE